MWYHNINTHTKIYNFLKTFLFPNKCATFYLFCGRENKRWLPQKPSISTCNTLLWAISRDQLPSHGNCSLTFHVISNKLIIRKSPSCSLTDKSAERPHLNLISYSTVWEGNLFSNHNHINFTKYVTNFILELKSTLNGKYYQSVIKMIKQLWFLSGKMFPTKQLHIKIPHLSRTIKASYCSHNNVQRYSAS